VDSATPGDQLTRHDVVEGSEPFGHAVFVQWVKDPLNPGEGKWECVPLGALPNIGLYVPSLVTWEPEMYSDLIVTANITWPEVPRT